MLKSVFVDGLKSLKEMKLDLQPGLNVLVGPNGSGKSNILLAFELISRLSNLETIIPSEFLGLNKIYDLFDIHNKNFIKISIEGNFNYHGIIKPEHNYELNYIYSCILTLNPLVKSSMHFSDQRFEITTNDDEQISLIDVTFSEENFNVKNFHEIVIKYFKKYINNEDYISNDYFNSFLESYYSSDKLKFYSIIHEFSFFFKPLTAIVQEMESMSLYNINPFKVRYDIKENQHAVLGRDGSRLSSVLHEVWKYKEIDKPITDSIYFPRTNFSSIYKNIIGYLHQINLEFKDIIINLDEATNELKCEVLLNGKQDDEVALPLELMSDGTLKWLSLVTAMLTTKNAFILEEPENYLNTSMQQMLVELLRETTEDADSFGIFSTHSETIQNELKPEEIIVTYFREGYTHATRIEDIDLLKKVMTGSGNGLGWYFLMSSLEPDKNGRILPKGDK